MPNLCLHCEQAPQENYLRLCNQCAAIGGLRRIYRKPADWTSERDAHLQALVEKAKRQLPLFPVEEASETEQRPGSAHEAQGNHP